MREIEAPLERLRYFRSQLAVDDSLAEELSPYRDAFAERRRDMAEDLFQAIKNIAQTKIVLQHQTSETRLKHNWSGWYQRLWMNPNTDEFLASLWRSGSKHVSFGVDHRFISLAYFQARRFTHGLIQELVPVEDQARVMLAADRLFDLCTLVETDAFIQSNSKCELDVMSGVAHQIRNPLTIIGGNAMRVQREAREGSRERQASQTILDEAKRLERMVRNVGVYIGALSSVPGFVEIDLEDVLERASETLRRENNLTKYSLDIVLTEDNRRVQGDPEMLTTLFSHLLQNAVEALDPDDPSITVTSGKCPASPNFVAIRIRNSGSLPQDTDVEELFTPFHSTKSFGTGFGLPIARLATRKNFGSLDIRSEEGGVVAEVTLPRPGTIDESGLFFRA
ncbi:ATP-binding protein [Desulfohalovibrio reitneri]|uniref:ATP-binding protein n=1 Tax=Desulfohalovibrio reitneri TaxID=1307759 RepID=UPI0004A73C93|nr:ATP-binding protein [Desulfohalovibrio reitneri]